MKFFWVSICMILFVSGGIIVFFKIWDFIIRFKIGFSGWSITREII